MLSTPTCYRWDGVEVPYAYLQGIYQFAIHDGTDHIPAGATQAWYPTQIWETHAKAQFIATANAPIQVILPDNPWIEADGKVDLPLVMYPPERSHAYQPKKGEHGPIGVKVADPGLPSAYMDGIGIAWNAHTPEQLPPENQGNNYMTVMVRFGIVTLDASVPVSDPTPITGGIWLTADQIQRVRASLLNVDDILRDATNRRPS